MLKIPVIAMVVINKRENLMRAFNLLSAAAIIAAVSFPAFAMEPMMMKKGETAVIMSDGTMGTVAMDSAMAEEMMKTAKPMENCMMMMMGEDGKMYMMEDMKMADGKMACESMMKM